MTPLTYYIFAYSARGMKSYEHNCIFALCSCHHLAQLSMDALSQGTFVNVVKDTCLAHFFLSSNPFDTCLYVGFCYITQIQISSLENLD